jgi:hypothetical protein
MLASSVQISEGCGNGDSGDSFAVPAKNLKKVFLGFLVVSPLFNHFLG